MTTKFTENVIKKITLLHFFLMWVVWFIDLIKDIYHKIAPSFLKKKIRYIYNPVFTTTSVGNRIEDYVSGYKKQLILARSWGSYSTGPIPIPTMWNWVGRGAGSVFIGEKTSQEVAKEIYNNIKNELK